MLVLATVLMMLPLPFVLESPGPTVNTTGEVQDVPVITIEGAESYPVTAGELLLTTVSTLGTPDSPIGAQQVIKGLLDETRVVVPVEDVYGDQDEDEVSEQQQQAMLDSQTSAATAALQTLGYEVPMTITVAAAIEDTAADGQLQAGDVLTAIARGEERTELPDFKTLTDFLRATPAGTEVTVEFTRDGEPMSVTFATTARVESDSRPGSVLGVYVTTDVELPIEVNFDLENIGGPSAGTMFALGVVDLLTEGNLTGGHVIAGTGTMSVDGYVGAIGGVRQKMVGAARDGAEYFLAPVANCDEVVGHEPDGVDVYAVETLDEAVDVVKVIAAGQTSALTTCESVQSSAQ